MIHTNFTVVSGIVIGIDPYSFYKIFCFKNNLLVNSLLLIFLAFY